MSADRHRVGDDSARAHMRAGDAEPRLHCRLDDGEATRLHQRLDDNDALMAELTRARFEMLAGLRDLKAAVQKLTDETAGIREMEADVTGALRLMARFSRAVGVLWKPLLFIAVAGASVYLWAKGVVAGAWR